jgi:hypothetical protein
MGKSIIIMEVIKLRGTLEYRKKFFIQNLGLAKFLFFKVGIGHFQFILEILALQNLSEFRTGTE